MAEHDRDRQMVELLESLLSKAVEMGVSLSHAQRFFDVGAWFLTYEELLHMPDLESLSTLKVKRMAAFQRLDEWFEL